MINQKDLTVLMDKWILDVNSTLTDLVHNLPPTPKLGPEFNSASFDPTWLVFHRLRSSLLKGQEADPEAHANAISKMLMEDSLLSVDLKTVKPQVRRSLYQARLLCNDWSRGLSFDVSSVDFSSGESFNSASGKTSLYQKLRNLDNWTLTADAEDLVVSVLYNNRGLKRVAMSHIRRVASRNFLRNCYKTIVNPSNLGLEVFTKLCRKYLFTYVYGSRVTTVPKNSTTRRTINVEPWLNLLCQRIIGLSIRSKLKSIGNDLEYGQSDHQDLIRNPTYATIDLASASNSNALTACEFMLHPRLFNRVSSVRSAYVLDTNTDCYYPLKMVSAMGCGFTFEIMTLVLLSVARTLDPTARVYGDDIIIKNRHASHFCECINALGYSINNEKTFISSEFRESCGSFWHDRVGYVEAYEIPLASTWSDAIAVANKLFLLRDVDDAIARAHKRVSDLSPRCIRGPYLESKALDSLNSWVWGVGHEWLKNNLDYDRETFMLTNVTKLCSMWSYPDDKKLIWSGIIMTPKLASPYTPIIKKGNVEKFMFYINSSRRVKDIVRNSYEFSTCLYATVDGISFLRLSLIHI